MLSSLLKQRWLLAIISGLLISISFPPLDWGFVAFIALIPLLFALKGATPRQAYRLGYLTGFVNFSTMFSWMTIFAYGKSGLLGGFSGILLAAILSIFTGLFAMGSSLVLNSEKLPILAKPFVIASIMVVLDYVRQLGDVGIGLGDLGYTQWHFRPILMDAATTGIWGLTWVVVGINVSLLIIRAQRINYSAAILFFLILALAGNKTNIHPSGQPYSAAALQANIDQDVPWQYGRPQDPVYFNNTLTTFNQLAQEASLKGAKLCVTAETSMPGYLDIDRDLSSKISAIAKNTNETMLVGGRKYDIQTKEDKNVIALYTGAPTDGMQSVAKQQLVPFGEFVPYQNLFSWVSVLRVANFNMEAGGANQTPIDAGSTISKIGTVVCYDMTYPRCIRYQLQHGANILAVGSDDTWFGTTAESRQSEATNAVRAAESGRYLIRASATGISAIFDNQGKVMSEVPIFTKGIAIAQVQPMTGETIFVRFGDWWVGVCAIIVIAACTVGRHRAKD